MSQEDLGDIARRLRAVEQDVAAARVPAGAASRDVTEIRVEFRDFKQTAKAGFHAMREDFLDLRQDFADLRGHVDRGFEQVDRGFIEMRGNLDATAAGQQRIVELIESLIDQQSR